MNTKRIAETGKNANCRLILNPEWTAEKDEKQTRIIVTTTMHVENRAVYRLDPDVTEDEPEEEKTDERS